MYLLNILIGIFIGLIPNHVFVNDFSEESSHKKKITNLVSIFSDLVKGALIVYITKFLMNSSFIEIQLSMISCLLTHSFFQGFKFNRIDGNVVALGGLFLYIPLIVLIWIIIWIISLLYKRNLNFSIIASTLLTGILSITSSSVINNEYWYTYPRAETNIQFQSTIGILFIIIFISEISQFRAYFRKVKSKDR